MKTGMMGWMRKTATAIVVLGAAAAAQAGTITIAGSGSEAEGRTVSAEAIFDFDASNDELTITLTNTEHTVNASQLLTGFEFEFQSFSGALSLDAASAIGRTVDGDGDYTDSSTPADLLAAPTWELSSDGSPPHMIEFHPDAKYGIIGAPNSDDDYSDASSGSIRGNDGENPFAAESATFTFGFGTYDLTGDLAIREVTFFFGTDLDTTVNVVPLPPSAWMGLGLLGVLGVARIRRRRRSL